jgi:hypothetical protein
MHSTLKPRSVGLVAIRQTNKFKVPNNKKAIEGETVLKSSRLEIKLLEAKKGSPSVKLSINNEVLHLGLYFYKSYTGYFSTTGY